MRAVLMAVAAAAIAAGFFTFWGVFEPPLEKVAAPPLHTFGDTVRERCLKEPGPEAQSQKDCVFRYTMGKAFEQFNERNR
jgi:hypothetical protein